MEKFNALPKMAQSAYTNARARQLQGQDFLSPQEFVDLWNKADGKCELSGVTFCDEPYDHFSEKRPHCYPNKPSLDRISNRLGYERGNVRLVTAIANTALNSWPEEEFVEMCRAVTARRSTDR
jgi:hypothetical protein